MTETSVDLERTDRRDAHAAAAEVITAIKHHVRESREMDDAASVAWAADALAVHASLHEGDTGPWAAKFVEMLREEQGRWRRWGSQHAWR